MYPDADCHQSDATPQRRVRPLSLTVTLTRRHRTKPADGAVRPGAGHARAVGARRLLPSRTHLHLHPVTAGTDRPRCGCRLPGTSSLTHETYEMYETPFREKGIQR